jgi:protein-disulfide isomerase
MVLYKECRLLILVALVSISANSYAENQHKQLVEKQKYEWVVEEILQQLTELRKEVNSMKQDVTSLNEKIDTLSKKVQQPPSRARAAAPSKVELGNNIMGDANASYAIVEFTDYQCPFCKRHSTNVLPQIKKELIDTGKVKYALRDYPLGFHGQAKGAAVAANCAGKQGKYWEMHEVLFENQRGLKDTLYIDTAQSLGLDATQFTKCLNNPANSKAVDADMAYGNTLGVTGTPKFFIGKVKGNSITDVQVISGAQAYGAFSGAIERLSSKK